MVFDQLSDLLLVVFIRDFIRARQCHRVRLDMFVDDKLHPRQADAVTGQGAQAESLFGAAQIDHHFRLRPGHIVQFSGGYIERYLAGVDQTHIALGTGQGGGLAIRQVAPPIADTDHSRNAEFPRDDGRMAGAAATLGDQRGGATHGRAPVRTGAFGKQHFAVLKVRQLLDIVDSAQLATCNAGTDGAPFCE